MLIDDNIHDNFFHERVIRKADAAAVTIVRRKASDAIEDLIKMSSSDPQYPELIFLDINMPGMNGWEFLDQFKSLEKDKQRPVIVMLTTSSNPDDRRKAEATGVVVDFRSKPLTRDVLEALIDKFLPGASEV